MEQHVKIIGIIDIVFGVLGILMGLLFMVMFLFGAAQMGAAGEDAAGGAAIFASLGIVFGIFFACLGIFEIMVGVKLRQFKSWAKVAQIVIGIMSLPSVPFGTAFGVYSLWAMFNQDTAALFEGGGQVQPPPAAT